jgi:hypothetical protein
MPIYVPVPSMMICIYIYIYIYIYICRLVSQSLGIIIEGTGKRQEKGRDCPNRDKPGRNHSWKMQLWEEVGCSFWTKYYYGVEERRKQTA